MNVESAEAPCHDERAQQRNDADRHDEDNLRDQPVHTLAHLVNTARIWLQIERDTAARAGPTAEPLMRALLAHRVEVAEAALAEREAALRDAQSLAADARALMEMTT